MAEKCNYFFVDCCVFLLSLGILVLMKHIYHHFGTSHLSVVLTDESDYCSNPLVTLLLFQFIYPVSEA